MKLKVKMRHFQRSLHTQKLWKVFQAQVGGRFAALSSADSDVDILAGNIKEVLLTTSDEVLEKPKRGKQP